MTAMHRHHVDYRAARRARYPDIGDQLDAVRALAEHLRRTGPPLPAEVVAWLDTLDAIKRAHPKPDTPTGAPHAPPR